MRTLLVCLLFLVAACSGEDGTAALSEAGSAPVISEAAFELANETIKDCTGETVIVAPVLPDQADMLALVGFQPALTEGEARVEEFSFVREYAAPGCADHSTEVVAFAGATETPPEIPLDAHGTATFSKERVVTVVLTPPLIVTQEKPYAFIGVRMSARRGESVCLAACSHATRPSANWWSRYPLSPFKWQPAPETTPGAGPVGYFFSVSGF